MTATIVAPYDHAAEAARRADVYRLAEARLIELKAKADKLEEAGEDLQADMAAGTASRPKYANHQTDVHLNNAALKGAERDLKTAQRNLLHLDTELADAVASSLDLWAVPVLTQSHGRCPELPAIEDNLPVLVLQQLAATCLDPMAIGQSGQEIQSTGQRLKGSLGGELIAHYLVPEGAEWIRTLELDQLERAVDGAVIKVLPTPKRLAGVPAGWAERVTFRMYVTSVFAPVPVITGGDTRGRENLGRALRQALHGLDMGASNEVKIELSKVDTDANGVTTKTYTAKVYVASPSGVYLDSVASGIRGKAISGLGRCVSAERPVLRNEGKEITCTLTATFVSRGLSA